MFINKVTRKQKNFKRSLKRKLVFVGFLGFLCSFYLLCYGMKNILFYRSVHYGNLLDYVISGYIPVALALAIIILVIIALLRGINQLLMLYYD